MWPTIMIIVFAVLLLVIIPAIIAKRKINEEFKKTGKYPEGHYQGIGMAFGMLIMMPFGFFFTVLTDNSVFTSLWIPTGLAIGLPIGQYLEKKNKDKIRPLTEKEKKLRTKMAFISLVMGFILGIGVVLFVILGK
jgi:glycopeptide antibiotics resistance protein